MRKARHWLKAIIVGAAVTKIAYPGSGASLIPSVTDQLTTNALPDKEPIDSLRQGLLKRLIMTAPGIILGVFVKDTSEGIPIIGNLLAGSLIVFITVIIAHSVIFGTVSGFFTGAVATTVNKTDLIKAVAKQRQDRLNSVMRGSEHTNRREMNPGLSGLK